MLIGESLKYFGHGDFHIDGQKHGFVIGATGSGKSTILLNLVAQTIREGHGCTVIDPHGPLVDSVIRHIPNSRKDDVIWIDPTATKVVGLNIFTGRNKQAALGKFIKIVSTVWADAWGPQSDYICRNIGLQEYNETRSAFIGELAAHRDRIDALLQKFSENGSRKNACSQCGSQDHTVRFHKKEA